MRTVKRHCRDCGAAVNVKLYSGLADGGTDAQRERAGDSTQREFWRRANESAVAAGYDGATACGRMGGWCAPYYKHGTRYTFADSDETPEFLQFLQGVEAAYKDVPEVFAAALRDVIAEDAEAERIAAENAARRIAERRACDGVDNATLAAATVAELRHALHNMLQYAESRLEDMAEAATGHDCEYVRRASQRFEHAARLVGYPDVNAGEDFAEECKGCAHDHD